MEIELKQALTNILDHLEGKTKEDYERLPAYDRVHLDVCFVRGWLGSASQREGVNRTYEFPVTELHVHGASVTVRASSPEDAKEKVRRGEGRFRYDGNVEGPRIFLHDELCAELRRMADHFDAYRRTLEE